MGLFDNFPYTNFHELNLDWILQVLKDIETTIDQFVSLNIVKYADPIQWDIVRQYPKNTIVIDPITGTAYISVDNVPQGVPLSNTDYWSVVFDLGRFITLASQNFANSYEGVLTTTATMPTSEGHWIVWNSVLYEALNDINVGDRYVIATDDEAGNIKRKTVETFCERIIAEIRQEILDRQDGDNALHTEIVNESVARENADDALQDNIDAEATARENADDALQDNIDAEATARVNADAAINTKIGDLSNLNTQDKTSIVNAINSVLLHSTNVVNVKEYGATGNGVTDDYGAITTALNTAITEGLPLYFPAGTYYVASPVIIPACDGLTIIGAGRNATTLKGYCVFRTEDSVLTDHMTITNITFRSMTGSTVPILNFTGHFYRSIIFNCAFYDWYTAVHIWYYLDSKILCCEFNNPLTVADSCIIISRNANGSSGANLTIAYCLLQGWQNEDDNKIYGKVGIEIRDGDAVYLDNVDMGRFIYNNVKITAQYRSDNHNFHNCYFDVTKSEHELLITGTAQMQHICVNNCWFASAGYIDGGNAAGIYCNARDIEDIHINDNRFINISGSGIHILSDNYIGVIDNNEFTNIGTGNIANNNYGIYLETPSTVANAAIVKNNYIYNCTGYGVAFGDNVKNVVFDGNILTNCEYHIGNACRSMRMNNPVQSITATSDMSDLNLGYDCYLVTGTTTISRLPDTVNGKMITFLFNSATPINTSGNIRLASAFTATAGSSITFMSFAHGWTEVGRAIV